MHLIWCRSKNRSIFNYCDNREKPNIEVMNTNCLMFIRLLWPTMKWINLPDWKRKFYFVIQMKKYIFNSLSPVLFFLLLLFSYHLPSRFTSRYKHQDFSKYFLFQIPIFILCASLSFSQFFLFNHCLEVLNQK